MSDILWVPGRRRAASGFPAGGAAGFAAASSQYLSIADNAALSMGSTTHFLIAGWVYMDTLTTFRYILSKSNGGGAGDIEYQIGITTFGNLFCRTMDNAGNTPSVQSSNTLSATTWSFFAFRTVTSFTRLRCNLNNTFTQSSAGANMFAEDQGHAFNLGRGIDGGGAIYHNGRLDSVGIWSRTSSAFADADITALYNSGNGQKYSDLSAGQLTDLKAFWNLDDTGNPSSWIDSHGSNHLTSNNGVTSVAGKL